MRSLVALLAIVLFITSLGSNCGGRPEKAPVKSKVKVDTTMLPPEPSEEKATTRGAEERFATPSTTSTDTSKNWRFRVPPLPPGAKWRRNTPVQEGPNVDLSQLPKELIYPGAKVLGRYGDYTFPGLGPSYNFVTNDSIDAVESYFRKSMAKWTTLKEIHEGDTLVWVMYESKDKKEVAEYIARQLPDRTSLVILHCRR
ncbi:MAG: hypothetical protein ABIK44_00335 [candidate division WOR-3 bacterium]